MKDERYIPASIRSRNGTINDVRVLDISIAGCMIEQPGYSLKLEDRVLIRISGLSNLPATVLWIEDNRIALGFEEPLYEPVVEHMQRNLPPLRAA